LDVEKFIGVVLYIVLVTDVGTFGTLLFGNVELIEVEAIELPINWFWGIIR
jgi:hypothetical protein